MADPDRDDAVRDLVRSIVEDVYRSLDGDLGGCGYYLRCMGVEGHEDSICSYGCREEPECITCEPTGGWPSLAPDYDYRKAWADEFTNYLLANVTVAVLNEGLSETRAMRDQEEETDEST